ncbi:hypothetical protein [Streptomyces noursei]|uniref:hypothetical protein n=1 Tax=Streptomyces noursei TaxID=1971 RepID=UPI001674CB58|nr:hypothetical protein [Streptomyces noursei]MCZ1021094.1 hypothetical protein [Streptomyces noursei]MCZ1021125.1 hypothetical protein [Streptomyces noursei]GGX51565.1 hypothetical protein GCM10010341_86340 [Streptomyces noursei]
MTATSAQHRAAQLAHRMFADLWPPRPDAHIVEVTEGRQLRTDDLVVLYSPHQPLTPERALSRASWRRVDSSSARTVLLRPVAVPEGTWDKTPDMTVFGEPWNDLRSPARMYVTTANRRMARVGTLHEIQARITSHPDFGEWQQAYTVAEDDERAQRRQTQALLDALEETRAPRRAAVRRLHEITGQNLLIWRDFGQLDRSVSGWLASDGRLRVYLTGLKGVGALTEDQYREALKCADTLGL